MPQPKIIAKGYRCGHRGQIALRAGQPDEFSTGWQPRDLLQHFCRPQSIGADQSLTPAVEIDDTQDCPECIMADML